MFGVSNSQKQMQVLHKLFSTPFIFLGAFSISIIIKQLQQQNIRMNPQNINQHIPLRHSLLWREPLLYEKEVLPQAYHQKQLNLLASQGVFWKNRNNFVRTKSQLIKSNPSSKRIQKNQNQKLYNIDESRISKASNLVQSMQFLKFSELTEGSSYVLAKYPGVIRPEKVYNDYHPKVANPNYNRNIKGKHFTS